MPLNLARRTCELGHVILLILFSVEFSSALDNTYTLTYHYSIQFSSVVLCRREHVLRGKKLLSCPSTALLMD